MICTHRSSDNDDHLKGVTEHSREKLPETKKTLTTASFITKRAYNHSHLRKETFKTISALQT